MIVEILSETGYEEALLGMSLSYYDHKTPLKTWWDEEKKERAIRRASKLAHMNGGHNKFLESINVQLYVQAPRSFWSEFDTYRVGMTKNSSSTMHTLDKREVTIDDFELGTSQEAVDMFNKCLADYKNPDSIFYKNISRLKCNLPEGWLQERQISTNYMTLKNIVKQRNKHRLIYWSYFITHLENNLMHPELMEWY